MGFRVDGQALQLFAVTPSSVSLFRMQAQTPIAQTLDHIGSETASVAMSDHSVSTHIVCVLVLLCSMFVHCAWIVIFLIIIFGSGTDHWSA